MMFPICLQAEDGEVVSEMQVNTVVVLSSDSHTNKRCSEDLPLGATLIGGKELVDVFRKISDGKSWSFKKASMYNRIIGI